MKTVTVLGSTGSIGRQTLEVAQHLGMQVVGLTAYSNEELLEEQIQKFKPDVAVLGSDPGGGRSGEEAISDIAENSGADIIVTAISGEAGMKSTLAAARTGKRIALANKEALVCAGELIMRTAREYGTEIIPVDSEHSAIFQCLAEARTREDSDGTWMQDSMSKRIKKIILTASGGPFRKYTPEKLKKVTAAQALRHPNWDMGQKITIDSATMMNKGLELIEAMHLFGVSPDQIEIVIHPESVIHSMVEFNDGSVIAQLSNPDMRMPIQYALTYPARLPGLVKTLDLTELGKLTFEKPDFEIFPCLKLAIEAAKKGTPTCAALSRANEGAVRLFLSDQIAFTDIAEIIKRHLDS